MLPSSPCPHLTGLLCQLVIPLDIPSFHTVPSPVCLPLSPCPTMPWFSVAFLLTSLLCGRCCLCWAYCEARLIAATSWAITVLLLPAPPASGGLLHLAPNLSHRVPVRHAVLSSRSSGDLGRTRACGFEKSCCILEFLPFPSVLPSAPFVDAIFSWPCPSLHSFVHSPLNKDRQTLFFKAPSELHFCGAFLGRTSPTFSV